jgi:hypothetical protein
MTAVGFGEIHVNSSFGDIEANCLFFDVFSLMLVVAVTTAQIALRGQEKR